jgi:hypothetical protein
LGFISRAFWVRPHETRRTEPQNDGELNRTQNVIPLL